MLQPTLFNFASPVWFCSQADYLQARFVFLFVCLFVSRKITAHCCCCISVGVQLECWVDWHLCQPIKNLEEGSRAQTWPRVGAFSEFKSVFVVKGDQACLCAWLSAWTCVRARRSVFWMLYRLKRAPGYIHVSRTRTRKAWSFGRGGLTEGDVQERKRPHIHVTEGSRKILSNGLIPARFYSPAFPRARREADAV